MEHTTIAVDLAKSVFQIAISHRPGRVDAEHRLSRARLLPFFATQPTATVLLEACGSAHHWGRALARLGHTVRLLPPHETWSGRPGSLLTLAPHRSGRAGSAASGSSTDSFATRRRVPAGLKPSKARSTSPIAIAIQLNATLGTYSASQRSISSCSKASASALWPACACACPNMPTYKGKRSVKVTSLRKWATASSSVTRSASVSGR